MILSQTDAVVQSTIPIATAKPALAKPATVPIIIEVAADGFIKAFGPKNADVVIINRPIASSAAAGCKVDELIDRALSIRHREVYFPSAVRGSGQVQQLTVQRVAELIAKLQLLESLSAISKPKLRPSHPRQLLARVLGASR